MQCYLAAKGEMWAKVGPHLLLFALLRSSRGYCVAVGINYSGINIYTGVFIQNNYISVVGLLILQLLQLHLGSLKLSVARV